MQRLFTPALIALFTFPAVAIAGPGVPGLEDSARPGPEQQVAHLDETLELDDDQEDAILAILTEVRVAGHAVRQRIKTQIESLRTARESGDEKAMKLELREMDDLKAEALNLRIDTHAAMRAQLTLTQQVLLEEAELERHQRGRPDGDKSRAPRERRTAE
ncbi:MAG: hypothetical protein GWP91_22650 [Rhodobacterales bacterium]|nr:hypothetical protein [Rhodobacterales bacterium]